MTDPRNIAHDKKVQQEKKHKGEEIAQSTAHAPQPGKKPHLGPASDGASGEPSAPDGEKPGAGT